MIKRRGDSWWVVVYAGRDPLTGRKRQKTGTARTRAEARQLEARLISEVGAGKHKGAATKTVADLLTAWLEWRQGVRPISPNTLANYTRYIDQKILPALGAQPITRVEAATIDRFYGLLRREGGAGGRPMSASAIHDVHAVLSGAFRQAMVWGWISHNPMSLVTRPSGEKPTVKPPEVSDAERLLTAAMDTDPELGLFVVLAAVLGARRSEVCSLRWSDVDFELGQVLLDSGVIIVAGQPLLDLERTKTRRRRRIAVGVGALELLRARRVQQAKAALAAGVSLAPDAYVFSHQPDGSAPIRPDGVTHRFGKLRDRLGVRCRLHDLRHFVVTQLLSSGVDVRTVAGRVGHEDGGRMTLGTYGHFQEAQDRRAAELLEGLLKLPASGVVPEAR